MPQFGEPHIFLTKCYAGPLQVPRRSPRQSPLCVDESRGRQSLRSSSCRAHLRCNGCPFTRACTDDASERGHVATRRPWMPCSSNPPARGTCMPWQVSLPIRDTCLGIARHLPWKGRFAMRCPVAGNALDGLMSAGSVYSARSIRAARSYHGMRSCDGVRQ